MEDTEPLESPNDDASAVTAEVKIELTDRELQELFYANGDTLLHEIERETGLYVAGRDSHLRSDATGGSSCVGASLLRYGDGSPRSRGPLGHMEPRICRGRILV